MGRITCHDHAGEGVDGDSLLTDPADDVTSTRGSINEGKCFLEENTRTMH